METGHKQDMESLKDYLEPMKIEYVKLPEGEPVKIRLLPDSPVITYKKFYKNCPCCDGTNGHIRYKSNVIDASDGKVKTFDFSPALKRELVSIIDFSYSYSVVRIGKIIMIMINKKPHIDIVIEKFHGSKPWPEYRVKQV